MTPGERFGEADPGTIRYLTASQDLDTRFPAFETEIDGIHSEGLLDADADADADGAEQCVRLADGTVLELPLGRYLGPADEIDCELVRDLRGPVLDVGCGPGRHLGALAARGVFGLGVDLSPIAVELATGRGVRAMVGSIFDELPGAGSWRSALLLDGNIGIGGAPERLLARICSLLDGDGELLVELDPPMTSTVCTDARIETTHGVSSWFRWARVSAEDIAAVARPSGLQATDQWNVGDRWFARLARVQRDY